MKGLKRQLTKRKPNDVELVPVFEFYANNNQSEGERKLVGAQLLDFCRMMGTTHIIARNIAFPEGHPNWSEFAIVDIKKLEQEIEGLIDIDKIVAREREKKHEKAEKERKENPELTDIQESILEEMKKGAEDAKSEDYE